MVDVVKSPNHALVQREVAFQKRLNFLNSVIMENRRNRIFGTLKYFLRDRKVEKH
jgi:hypothetical protein